MAITLDGTNGITTPALENDGVTTVAAGSASAPAITTDGDTNTGIFFPAADTIAFAEGGAEAMRINSSGNVGIGTSSPTGKVDIVETVASPTSSIWTGETLALKDNTAYAQGVGGALIFEGKYNSAGNYSTFGYIRGSKTDATDGGFQGGIVYGARNGNHVFVTNGTGLTDGTTERMRIDSSGNLLVGKTTSNRATAGFEFLAGGAAQFTNLANIVLNINRENDDGVLINFRQANAVEGTISVSGTTVSYNGGHLSRWAQLTTPKDDTPLFKGTVMSNLDEMNVYIDADGNPVENEQLNKVKVSDVEGDANVAGVFVNWEYDEAHQVDEINMAMTGDMIIRIAQGVTVVRGDLLMSAGDGTAKPQDDDIVRSKTVAKVTSTHVTCTYDDGSYCVPCVLMAC